MKKLTARLWMLIALPLLLGLASCTDTVDNPVTNPDEPQQQLADYTIIWYGHGGGNLDLSLTDNMMQFYMADADSYDNVKIAAQYKYSALEGMEDTFDDFAEALADYYEPGTADYDEAMQELEAFKTMYYPMAGKTTRFVVDMEHFMEFVGDAEAPRPTGGWLLPGGNADITRPDSLANFIDWAVRTCPARKYILVLSDHGGGYLPNDELPAGADAARKTRGVVYDDGNDSRHFTAKTLAQAISQASVRPSVVYLDACLMNTAEYQFELAPTTDYLVLSTFTVPGEGGNYPALIDALSENPDDLETALTDFAKATVDGWDETAEEDAEEEGEPVYHDINVYRTADIDALGAQIKTFTDRLVSAYQTGGDDVRAKIDEVTANAYRVNEQIPAYDLIDYAVNLTLVLPDVFGSVWDSPLGQAFDRCIVYQQSSRWLQKNDGTVDLSVLLGCQGHYTLDEGFMQMRFDADGTAYPIFYTGLSEEDAEPWGSTLDETYGQLRFDQLTGWSRWLRLNQQEPNPESATGYNPFDRRKRK